VSTAMRTDSRDERTVADMCQAQLAALTARYGSVQWLESLIYGQAALLCVQSTTGDLSFEDVSLTSLQARRVPLASTDSHE
jgi:hypothetical protein